MLPFSCCPLVFSLNFCPCDIRVSLLASLTPYAVLSDSACAESLGGHFGPEKKYLATPPPPNSPQAPSQPLAPPPPPAWETLPLLEFSITNRPPTPPSRLLAPFPLPEQNLNKKISETSTK